MFATVKGLLAAEVVLDLDRYPDLEDRIRGIIASEFLGDQKPTENGKKRGRPAKGSQPMIPEATQILPVEGENPLMLTQ